MQPRLVHNLLIGLGLILAQAWTVAPPDFREVKVGEMQIELPGPGDSIMGRHRMGDTLRFSVKGQDNGEIYNLSARLSPTRTQGITSVRNFLTYNLSKSSDRTDRFELSFRVVLRPDTVQQTVSYCIFDQLPDNGIIVESVFGLEAGRIEEIVLSLSDDRGFAARQPYSFFLEE